MNMDLAHEEALIEASRIQRAALADLGLTFAELFPGEAAELRRFLGAQAPKPSTEKED